MPSVNAPCHAIRVHRPRKLVDEGMICPMVNESGIVLPSQVWMLSLCRDLSCTDFITSIPMAGFQFGDAPHNSFLQEAGHVQTCNINT